VKFKRKVVPGDTLVIQANFVKRKKPLWMLDCTVMVDGKLASEARILAADMPPEAN
jgi:3-hydroxyacyl-[acyl-carrier-protein] dehydratase